MRTALATVALALALMAGCATAEDSTTAVVNSTTTTLAPCQEVYLPTLWGSDSYAYGSGVWSRNGVVIGYALQEDSTIWSDANCL